MKEKMILLAMLLIPMLINAQDLELRVHILPTRFAKSPDFEIIIKTTCNYTLLSFSFL